MKTSIILFIVLAIGIGAVVFGKSLPGKKRRRNRYSTGRSPKRASTARRATGRHVEANAEQRGRIGEEEVTDVLIGSVHKSGFILNNVLFSDGNTSIQIDHILVDERGVFVIETKNYSGWIFGKESDEKWTQVLARGEQKNTFYNPIRQNNTHITHLKRFLPEGTPVCSYVVMVQNNAENIRSDEVVDLEQLRPTLKNCPNLISTAQIEKIKEVLLNLVNDSAVSEEEHVKNIRATQQKIAHNICPRCNGRLVERTNHKTGEKFYGCENYPQCKFIKRF